MTREMEKLNRKIAFRAWDKKKKSWLKPKFGGYLCIGNDAVVVIDYKPVPNGTYAPEKINQLTWEEVDNLEIMQFTGLKDKNGTDIFEGDLVNCWLEKGFNEADDVHTGEIVFDETRAAYFCKRKDGYQLMLNNFFKFEVIGNIWEK